MQATLSRCPGCALELPASDGPTHAYIGASAACWSLFGELLLRLPGRLATDAYAVQHPGVPERRAIQSVGVHLIGLCLQFEHGLVDEKHAALLKRVLARAPEFVWLDPPRPNGRVTVRDVVASTKTGEEWALDVWAAWSPHHDTVRAWLSQSLTEAR